MAQPAGPTTKRATRATLAARVALLISTHALPPFSYRIPEHLSQRVRVGSAVVATLSGHPRLGIVVGFEPEGERDLEVVRDVREDLSLSRDMVGVCQWVCEVSAVPLAIALRAALPPGLNIGSYRVRAPAPGWRWKSGTVVARTTLRRVLGRDGLRAAEADGRIEFAPELPQPRDVEFALVRSAADPDLSRAPRQRELFEYLKAHPGGLPVAQLLRETGANRPTLKELARRGAVTLQRRAEPTPIFETTGTDLAESRNEAQFGDRCATEGGSWLWRVPMAEHATTVAGVIHDVLTQGRRALVLAPEIEAVDRLVRSLRASLPPGYRVAAYHSGLEKQRSILYAAVREGDVDLLVGTRTAAMLPVPDLGIICVVDEPNEAHRAEPGYEGLPIHARDLALCRGRIEDCAVLCLSPTPSLRLYASPDNVQELPEVTDEHRPAVRIVDMRGAGVDLSATLVSACRRAVEDGERVGLIANRLGYATVVTCNRCGSVKNCPRCDRPLTLMEGSGSLVCGRCGYRGPMPESCEVCGSERLSATGLGVKKVREEVCTAVQVPVGIFTASERNDLDASLVVGTPQCILGEEWDTIMVVDADAVLLGSGMGTVERAFRLLYRATEAALQRVFVQTRVPEHYALQTALRRDYPAFAAAELPRLRALRYPPYAHLASVTFEGRESVIRHAVESRLRPTLDSGVEMSELVVAPGVAGAPVWRVLIRGAERASVARAATRAARVAGGPGGARNLRVRVDVDPEEV